MAISFELAGNFFLHEFLIFDAAAFEAFPRNEQAAVLLGLLAADERLHGGMRLDEPREQRTLVHVVKHGESCSARVRSLMTSMSADAVNSPSNSWSSRMKSRRRLERFSLNWSRSIAVSMARKTSGPRMSAKSSLRSRPKPEQQFAAGRVLADEPRERFLEQIHFALVDEQARKFRHSLAETRFSAPRKISCQRSGFASLNDSSAR
jgi:hypothetical protein